MIKILSEDRKVLSPKLFLFARCERQPAQSRYIRHAERFSTFVITDASDKSNAVPSIYFPGAGANRHCTYVHTYVYGSGTRVSGGFYAGDEHLQTARYCSSRGPCSFSSSLVRRFSRFKRSSRFHRRICNNLANG